MVEFARSFFPIFLIVLILRAFLFEPFRIPSGSMMPTLLIGDFILVNKYTYGIRLPVINKKIIELNSPERGDIVVFRYPEDPSIPFIKRVIGIGGDEIGYFDKVLYINGKRVDQTHEGYYSDNGAGRTMNGAEIKRSSMEELTHQILLQKDRPGIQGQTTVPEGHFFVLGDNRDNSRDSRYWGFVPDENLIGRAFMIWMNLDFDSEGIIDWKRLGNSIYK